MKVDTTGLDALNPEAVKVTKEEKEEVKQEETKEEKEDVGASEDGKDKETEETGAEGEEDESIQAESKKDEDKGVDLVPKDVVQNRISRMYARMKKEQEKNAALNLESAKLRMKVNNEDNEDSDTTTPPSFTQEQAEAIWDRKEKEKKFRESETKVLLRHTGALNDDGSFNMKDSFAKEYLAVGQENPGLGWMVNGPELAEAMIEKKTSISFKEGKKAGAEAAKKQTVKAKNAHTGSSTVAISAGSIMKLSGVEKKIAARMGMTEKQYTDYSKKIKSGDKTVA